MCGVHPEPHAIYEDTPWGGVKLKLTHYLRRALLEDLSAWEPEWEDPA